MEKPVSAADANRKFSKLLRAVREGKSYVVTSHGRAVARIVLDMHDAKVQGAPRSARSIPHDLGERSVFALEPAK